MNLSNFWKIINMVDIMEVDETGSGIELALQGLQQFSAKEILLFGEMYDFYYHQLYQKFHVDEVEGMDEAYRDVIDFIILLGKKAYFHFYHLDIKQISDVLKYVDSLFNKVFLGGCEFSNPPYLQWYGYQDIYRLVPEAYEKATGKVYVSGECSGLWNEALAKKLSEDLKMSD